MTAILAAAALAVTGTSVDMPRHRFADTVTATLTVSFDQNEVDAGNISVRARFRPYRVVAFERAHSAGVIRFRWRIACVDRACLAPAQSRRFVLAPVEVRVRDERTSIPWPPLEQGSRLRPGDLGSAAFRLDLAPPKLSYRRGLAPVLYGLAAVLLLAGLLVLRPLMFARRRRDARPPLERALAFVDRARGSEELRRALDRLARELRLDGADELAGSARRLAWSSSEPGDPDLGRLTGRVRRLIGAAG